MQATWKFGKFRIVCLRLFRLVGRQLMWRSGGVKLLWIHFPLLGFGFEGPLTVEGWMWQQEFNPIFGEMRHYFHVFFSFQNLESDSLLTDSLSVLFCSSSFVLAFVFTAPDNKLELAKHQLCCLKLKRLLNRSLPKMSGFWSWCAQIPHWTAPLHFNSCTNFYPMYCWELRSNTEETSPNPTWRDTTNVFSSLVRGYSIY